MLGAEGGHGMANPAEEELETGPLWVVVGPEGAPVGVAQMVPHAAQPVRQALEAHGFRVAEAVASAEGVIDVAESCNVENPRPCEVNITLAQIRDLAVEAGAPTDAIDTLAAQGLFAEEEAAAAIRATVAAMPAGPARETADLWYRVAFEGEGA